jgi:methionyl-tRNA synthetase
MSKYYVATTIPYVNDKPHLGHAMLHLYADVIARYRRQLGEDVMLSCGTDEHGGKMAEAAAKAKMQPKQFVDLISNSFREGLKELDISYDRFIRTTDPEHEKRAQLAWTNMAKDFYKKSYEGWYCVGCEEFKTEEYVKETKGVCPLHNRAYEKLQEENYFFKLSKYGPAIAKAVEADEYKVIPAARKKELLNVINSGLEDLSISRPSARISWGIPVPGDPTQTMYVWFEALLNYITTLGYPDNPDFKKYWPADVQVIGKDILRFHGAIWPAMLMSLGLPIPKRLFVHGFVTSGGKKMSKTLGNVIDPLQLVHQYGVDAFRYYIYRHIPTYTDGDFSMQRFEAAYNGELADELGNAVSRTAAMITKYQQGMIGEIPEPKHDIAAYSEAMENFRFDRAMDEVWEQVRGLNQYIDEEKPWLIASPKKGEPDSEHLREVLANCASSLLEISAMSKPFMPRTAAAIESVFASGIIKPLATTLFPKLQVDAASK